MQKCLWIVEAPMTPVIENFCPEIAPEIFKTHVKEVTKVRGKILLTDAEIVVSGGKGMKGPENWGPL